MAKHTNYTLGKISGAIGEKEFKKMLDAHGLRRTYGAMTRSLERDDSPMGYKAQSDYPLQIHRKGTIMKPLGRIKIDRERQETLEVIHNQKRDQKFSAFSEALAKRMNLTTTHKTWDVFR